MTKIYYVDEYDTKTARWKLIASQGTKREAISAAKILNSTKPIRIRRVEEKIILEGILNK